MPPGFDRHRRSPTPYPSRSTAEESGSHTNAKRLLSILKKRILQRCHRGRSGTQQQGQEKPQSRPTSRDSAQLLGEEGYSDITFEKSPSARGARKRVPKSGFHRMFATFVSKVTSLPCAIFRRGCSRSSRSLQRDCRPWSLFGILRSPSKRHYSRSISPHRCPRRGVDKDWRSPSPRNRSAQAASIRSDSGPGCGPSHQSFLARQRRHNETQAKLRGAVEDLRTDLCQTLASMRAQSNEGPGDVVVTMDSLSRLEAQVDQLVEMVSGDANSCAEAPRRSAASDSGTEQDTRKRQGTGSIHWDDHTTTCFHEKTAQAREMQNCGKRAG